MSETVCAGSFLGRTPETVECFADLPAPKRTRYDTDHHRTCYKYVRRDDVETLAQDIRASTVFPAVNRRMINDPEFERLLADYRLAALHSSDDTIYALRPDLTLAYFNEGWSRFAARNSGEPSISLNWSIGRCVQDAIAEPLRLFFAENYAKCLRENRPWEHHYECSSPELFRTFIMITYPLGRGEGLLVVNSLAHETSNTRPAHEPLEVLYNDGGLIKQCSHCRRVRRSGTEKTWDWVPEWVRVPLPNTSHGLCEACFGYYYPKQRRSAPGFPEIFRTGE